MDLQLAASAVSLLAPYLAKAGESASTKAGEGIYQYLKARFEKKPSANEALDDLEKKPTNVDRQAAVRVQLEKLLEADQAFAVELQQMLQSLSPSPNNSTIITQTANDHAVQIGQMLHGGVTTNKQ